MVDDDALKFSSSALHPRQALLNHRLGIHASRSWWLALCAGVPAARSLNSALLALYMECLGCGWVGRCCRCSRSHPQANNSSPSSFSCSLTHRRFPATHTHHATTHATTHRAPLRSGCSQDLSEPRGPLRRRCPPPPLGPNEVRRRRSAGAGVVCLCCVYLLGQVILPPAHWYNSPCLRRWCVKGLCVPLCAMCWSEGVIIIMTVDAVLFFG